MPEKSGQEELKGLRKFESLIGYEFKDRSLLLNSLVHRSYANENKGFKGVDNERLELLGDSVLGLVVVEYLFRRFNRLSEGELVKMKSAIVSEASLAEFAKLIQLGNYLYLSRGEELGGGRERPSILADAFESVMGAIYIDGGLEESKRFLIPFLISKVEELNSDERVIDFKTLLQEHCQAKYKQLPQYELEGESGPEHNKRLRITLSLKGRKLSTGEGGSRKEAEQRAAKEACMLLNVNAGAFF